MQGENIMSVAIYSDGCHEPIMVSSACPRRITRIHTVPMAYSMGIVEGDEPERLRLDDLPWSTSREVTLLADNEHWQKFGWPVYREVAVAAV